MTYQYPQVGEIYIRTIASKGERAIKLVGIAESDKRGAPTVYKTKTVFDTAKPERVGDTERTISASSLYSHEWRFVRQNPKYTEEINIEIAAAWQRGYESRPTSD
jgi:hypothetical protein